MDKRSIILLLLGVWCAGLHVHAQDTTKRKSIDITSSFKPVLREAVKINFNAAPPVADTTHPRLNYTIPSQYMFLSYQPGELKPVALQRDTLVPWENYNYIKLGIGNVVFPVANLGFSFGDGKSTFVNIFANQLSSHGNLENQKSSLTDVKVDGTFKTQNNLEWNASLAFKNDEYYLYGYPDTVKYTPDQLRQTFQTITGGLSLRNTVPTEFGLLYHPSLKFSVFSDNHTPQGMESNSVLNLPLEKLIGKEFAFDLGLTADLTHYNRPGGPAAQNNNLYYVTPGFQVKTTNFFLLASVIPSWDNQIFHLLPNFVADISTSDQRLTLTAGWIGYYDKGSYQRFESINPWVAQPDSLQNTRVQELYFGIKGSLDNHFSYAAKVGFQSYDNMPLFVNDSIDGGKDFQIRYARSMGALQVHGEVSYLYGEQFQATASLTTYKYTNFTNEPKAWGMLPAELKANLKWEAFKEFWAKLDLFAFQGAPYRAPNGAAFTGPNGFDMNAGVELRILKQLNLWFQMNNIFNDKYERWHQYPVYGFNVVGGIVFSFGGK
ncbi:MAG TPA: hypothetical protein VG101_04755 [Puia sp.]|nr:hypothetical protein [Puia sp.]